MLPECGQHLIVLFNEGCCLVIDSAIDYGFRIDKASIDEKIEEG